MPEIRVQDEQGNTHIFPDGSTPEMIAKAMRVRPPATVSAAPAPFSPAGIKSKLLTARDWAVNQLPAVGGTLGGIVGAGAGAESGPGAILTSAAGAAAGGGLGEDARQVIDEHFHPEDKIGPLESGVRIAGQAGIQGANEAGGRLAGKVTGKLLAPAVESFGQKYPALAAILGYGETTSPKAAERLTAAGSTPAQVGKVFEDVGNTLGDIEEEMRNLPMRDRTVEGFLKSVNARKDAMNAEAGAAMLPIAGQQTVPLGVSQNIRNLVRSYMNNTAEGRANEKYIIKRAAEFQKPWTYRSLDELRTDLASTTAKHQAKNPVAKYTAEKGDLDLQIDNAILDGLRDTVYPEMDRASHKPAGYWANLKGRQSSLIRLQDVLDKRVKDLKGSQAVSDVAPRFGTENFSASVHAGSAPRLGMYGIRQALAPKKVLKEANKHVARAFPNVTSLPYEVLFTAGIRGAEVKGPAPRNATDEWQGIQ